MPDYLVAYAVGETVSSWSMGQVGPRSNCTKLTTVMTTVTDAIESLITTHSLK